MLFFNSSLVMNEHSRSLGDYTELRCSSRAVRVFGNFLKRLFIYIVISPIPMLTQVVVKIIVELPSVLALASKRIKERRFSTCNVTYVAHRSVYHRKNHRKVAWGGRNRDHQPKIGSIDSGGSLDDCCKCKGSPGRCVMVT